MERRSFVKNIFGSVIGFAIFPTAIKEFAESKPIEVPIKYEYFVDLAKFRIGEIIKLPNGKMYAIISGFTDQWMQARCLTMGPHDIMLKPLPAFQQEDKVLAIGARTYS